MPFDAYDLTQPDCYSPSEWMKIRELEVRNFSFGCRYARYENARPTEWCSCDTGQCKASATAARPDANSIKETER
jgi:hypothetical protein